MKQITQTFLEGESPTLIERNNHMAPLATQLMLPLILQ